MTKNDFIFRQRAAKREGIVVYIVCMVFFLAIVFADRPLSEWIDLSKLAPWMQVAHDSIYFGLLIGIVILMYWLMMRRYRKFGLFCPACNKPLLHTASQIAIATGNCSHCGASLFEQ